MFIDLEKILRYARYIKHIILVCGMSKLWLNYQIFTWNYTANGFLFFSVFSFLCSVCDQLFVFFFWPSGADGMSLDHDFLFPPCLLVSSLFLLIQCLYQVNKWQSITRVYIKVNQNTSILFKITKGSHIYFQKDLLFMITVL